MAKNFELRDVDGNVLWSAPENERVLSVSVRTAQGESSRVGVQNDTYFTLVFETTGRLNPNLLDVEDARREARREWVMENSPETPSDDDEDAQNREGQEQSADFLLTSGSSDYKTPKDFVDAKNPDFTDPNSESETGPSEPGTDQENADGTGSETTDDDTNDQTPTTPHAGDARDHAPLNLGDKDKNK